MYKQKTKETDSSVTEFIQQIESRTKREDALRLLAIFNETSGYTAKMWGPSIIGFGSYHYKYVTGHEGDAPLVGFSPQKTRFSLYFAAADPHRAALLKQLGKHKAGKSCVYMNKLADIDTNVLRQLILQSVHFLKKRYPEKTEGSQK